MRILVVGGGGREHALIRKLKENEKVSRIFALPGNGGISRDADCVPISATDIPAIVEFAQSEHIDYAVVAPDDPLVLGCVDALAEVGIPAFGPNKRAAIIEGSKVFSKELMKKYNIPTADYRVFDRSEEALSYLEKAPYPIVIKADGLALGKGVIIAMDQEEADRAVREIMENRRFGASGDRIVIEEFLEGPEVSVLAFTDGKSLLPMVTSMDHKRIGDGDTGLNTGGMGAVAPNPYYTKELADRCMKEIFLPTMEAMKAEERPFRGCLYFGLMLTAKGPKVIEYNCRFGDPEAQAVLPLLETDLLTIMQAVSEGRLSEVPVVFSEGASCCVVMASGGYPVSYEKGKPIHIPEEILENIFIAGAEVREGLLLTSGGRVLGCTAVQPDLQAAVDAAYGMVEQIHFEKAYYRKDIGQRALSAQEEVQ